MKKMLLTLAVILVSAGCGGCAPVKPLPDPFPSDTPITVSSIPTATPAP